MQNVFRSINNLSPKDVLGPGDVAKQKYDILLINEAHRLTPPVWRSVRSSAMTVPISDRFPCTP